MQISSAASIQVVASRKRFSRLGTVLILIAVLCSWSGLDVSAAPSGQSTVSVAVQPAEIIKAAGDQFEVDVVINGVADLGAFELSLRYDPALVQVDKAVIGKLVGSSNRTVVPLGPQVDQAAGKVALGAVTVGTQPGAKGNGVLMTLSCTALRAGQGQLTLDAVRLTDTKGQSITATPVDGKVIFTGDVVVPTMTATPVTPTLTPTLTATLIPTFAVPTITATPTTTAEPTAVPTLTATIEPTAAVAATAVGGATPDPGAVTADPAQSASGGATPTPDVVSSATTVPSQPPAMQSSGSGLGIGIGIVVAVVVLAVVAYLWRRGRQ
jgi:hypothetical protein